MATSTLPNIFGNRTASAFTVPLGTVTHNYITKVGKLVTCELRAGGDVVWFGAAAQVATIPAGFRPYQDIIVLGAIYVQTSTFDEHTGWKPCKFEIKSTGEVCTGWGSSFNFTWIILSSCWYTS